MIRLMTWSPGPLLLVGPLLLPLVMVPTVERIGGVTRDRVPRSPARHSTRAGRRPVRELLGGTPPS